MSVLPLPVESGVIHMYPRFKRKQVERQHRCPVAASHQLFRR